jgi:PAS domain S-box-containing protein
VRIEDILDPAPADRELARKLAIAIRAAELGVWEWDLRTNEFIYSGRAKQIFGFDSHEQVTRERIIAVLHPDDHQIARDQAARSLDPSLEKRDPYRYRIYRADTGELRWIHAFGEPVFEVVEGKLAAVRFIGTLQDVTDEVAAKERLVQQEARLRLAIEASGIAVWELNLADQSVMHSPELNKLCGFPPDATPSLEEFRSRYAPGERERIEKLGAEARARGDTKMEAEIRHIWPDGTEKWLALRAQLAPGQTAYGGRVIGVLVDITDQKRREEQQALLLSELKHRIKNSFAVSQAVISQSLRGEEVPDGVRSKLLARLHALSVAHDDIVSGAWASASLLAVLTRARSTFDEGQGERVRVEGEDVTLNPRAALAFSLVFHELFTNSVKYGSLSTQSGYALIEIFPLRDQSNPTLRIVWSEHGGPEIGEPTSIGFGSRLLERVLVAEFEADVRREFRKAGFICRIETPLGNISADDKRSLLGLPEA